MTMSEAKPIASLSSVLLARKGAARPAMRRQVIGNGHGVAAAAAGHEDLGWNDMGYDVDPDPAAPMDYEHGFGVNPLAAAVPEVTPEVKAQQNLIAEQLNVQAEAADVFDVEQPTAPVVPIAAVKTALKVAAPAAKSKPPRAAAGSKAKSAFTLRLDGDRHLRLRLACAISNRSAQMLVTAALDAFIDSMPEIGALAAQIPSKSSNQSR